MKKTVIALSLLVVLMCGSLVSEATVLTAPVGSILIEVQDAQGESIEGAHAWLYVYEDGTPALLFDGQTDAHGSVSVVAPALYVGASTQTRYQDFTLHVFHPEKGLLVRNWSKAVDTKEQDDCRTVQFDNKPEASTFIQPRGSGYFRTVRVDTIPTIKPVVIAEMYHIPELTVETSFEAGMTTEIQTKAKILWPIPGGWNPTGSLTRTTGGSGTAKWRSLSIPSNYDGMELLTEFNFAQEIWELQEQDEDLYDLWHTRERWVEVKQTSYYGGCDNGNLITTTENDKPFAEVYNFTHGERQIIGSNNEWTQETWSSTTYAQGVSFTVVTPYGIGGTFEATSTTTYNQKLKHRFDNDGNDFRVAIYDRFSGKSKWYVTREY